MAAFFVKGKPGTYTFAAPGVQGMKVAVLLETLEQEIHRTQPDLWVRYDSNFVAISPDTRPNNGHCHAITLSRSAMEPGPEVTDYASLVACAGLYVSRDRKSEMNLQIGNLVTAQQFNVRRQEIAIRQQCMRAEEDGRQTVEALHRMTVEALYAQLGRRGVKSLVLRAFLNTAVYPNWSAQDVAAICILAGISYLNLMESVARNASNG